MATAEELSNDAKISEEDDDIINGAEISVAGDDAGFADGGLWLKEGGGAATTEMFPDTPENDVFEFNADSVFDTENLNFDILSDASEAGQPIQNDGHSELNLDSMLDNLNLDLGIHVQMDSNEDAANEMVSEENILDEFHFGDDFQNNNIEAALTDSDLEKNSGFSTTENVAPEVDEESVTNSLSDEDSFESNNDYPEIEEETPSFISEWKDSPRVLNDDEINDLEIQDSISLRAAADQIAQNTNVVETENDIGNVSNSDWMNDNSFESSGSLPDAEESVENSEIFSSQSDLSDGNVEEDNFQDIQGVNFNNNVVEETETDILSDRTEDAFDDLSINQNANIIGDENISENFEDNIEKAFQVTSDEAEGEQDVSGFNIVSDFDVQKPEMPESFEEAISTDLSDIGNDSSWDSEENFPELKTGIYSDMIDLQSPSDTTGSAFESVPHNGDLVEESGVSFEESAAENDMRNFGMETDAVRQPVSENPGYAKWFSGSENDKYFEINKQSPSEEITGFPDCNAIHINSGYDTYGWLVCFDNGVIMGLPDVREFQLRNGSLPASCGLIKYGNNEFKFNNIERIVVYQSIEYFSYGV